MTTPGDEAHLIPIFLSPFEINPIIGHVNLEKPFNPSKMIIPDILCYEFLYIICLLVLFKVLRFLFSDRGI